MSDMQKYRDNASISRASAVFKRDPKLVGFVWELAKKNNIDPMLGVALAEWESRFNPNAVGKNADSADYGLVQINSKTFKNAATMTEEERVTAGFKHLAWLLQKHKGNMETALREYNGGGRWAKKDVTAQYARNVLGNYTKLSSELRNLFKSEGIAGF